MPSGRACLAIMVLWVVMTQDLIRRDVLPNLILGAPPDFRTLSQRGESRTSHWMLLASDSRGQFTERPVGEVFTQTKRRTDGSMRLESKASLHASFLLQDSPLKMLEGPSREPLQDTRLEIIGSCEVDQSGNLDSFRVVVREDLVPPTDLLLIKGLLKGDLIAEETETLIPLLSGTKEIPYRPHSMVENALGPIDMMPGLQVGQRWESRVANPLTGKVDTGTAEVVGKQHIQWNQNPVPTFVVLTKTGPLSARTWVRTDGLVLRQEVPLLVVKLVLERVPELRRDTP